MWHPNLIMEATVSNIKSLIARILLVFFTLYFLHAQDGGSITVTRTGDSFTCSIQKASFVNVMDTLFRKSGKEYALLSKPNITLENMTYSDKEFDALLAIILSQCSCDYTLSGGVYYIYEIQKKDVVKQLKETRIIRLEYISIDALASLMPAELNSSTFMRQDKAGNSVILTGSPSEINPIEEFIKKVDVADGRMQNRSVRLKYIRSDELMRNLPPSVTKTNVTETNQSEIVFFTGTERQYEDFMKELALIDQPKRQIKYQLLVIQRQKTEGNNWGTSLSTGSSSDESGYTWTGMLSNIFNINFDIIAQFGLQFAGSLNAELSEGHHDV